MAGVGLDPAAHGVSEKASVTVYQNTLAPAGRGGEKNDIYLHDAKVVLLGLDGNPSTGAEGSSNEYTVTASYGPDVRPSTVAHDVLAPLAQALVRGINGVVLLLGHTGSGKPEMMRGGGQSSGTWDGLVERAVEEVYALLPEDGGLAQQGEGAARHVLSMRFLNLTEERVQDLLQSDCHAHDLELLDEPHGVVANGTVAGELKSRGHALQLCRQGVASLQSLQRYHSMDASAAASLLTLTLTQLPAAAEGGVGGGMGGGLGGAAAADAVVSSLTLVELPGTEKLGQTAEDRTRLHVTEGSLANRSITQFAELVRSLARRRGPEHVVNSVPSKLTRLLSPLLGANARVHALAALRSGEPEQCKTTLQLAERLMKVTCYPVVNGGAARGLVAISRSEIMAMKNDMEAMQLQGVPAFNAPPAAAPYVPPPQPEQRPAARPDPESPVAPDSPEAGAPAGAPAAATPEEEEDSPRSPEAAAPPPPPPAPPPPQSRVNQSEAMLAQSALEGKLLLTERQVVQAADKARKAVDDKALLQRQYDALLEEKQAIERAQLAAEHEKLKVAKAIVDLQVEGNAQQSALEARVAELRAELGAAERTAKDLTAEARRAHADLEEREAQLALERGEKEDLLNELLAARLALQKVQEAEAEATDHSKALDLELVSTVNQAERRAAQLAEQAAALDRARAEAARLQEELFAAERRGEELGTQLAAAAQARDEAAAKVEGLRLAVRRAEVQREISQVAAERERGGLAHEKQAAEAATAEAAQRGEIAASEAVAAERRHGEAQSRELAISRAELHAQQEHIQAELLELLASREAQLEAAEARTQQAHEVFRETLAAQLERDAAVNQSKSGEATGGISEAISELRAALVASYTQREDQLLAQLSEARRRESELLEARRPLPVLRAARDASAVAGDEGGGGEGGAVDESRGAAVARAEAEAHLVAERASAELLSEAREECEGLRRHQRVMQERLREAAKKYQLVLDDMSADRRQLAQQADEARSASESARRQLERSESTASVREVADESEATQRELLRQIRELTMQKEELGKQSEQLAQSTTETRALRAENERLRTELAQSDAARGAAGGGGAAGEVASLRFQVRELQSSMAQLEAERCALKMRSTSAEEQLSELQGAMSSNILRYQKEILRLRQQGSQRPQ